MDGVLQRLMTCVARGKVNRAAPYPPDLKDQDGADELTRAALDAGIEADTILQGALVPGMNDVGTRFARHEAFMPDLLMSAKAMNAAMAHLKPYFASGQAHRRGTLIIGTVHGDMHDIGKRLADMVIEGAGWEVVDLGVDVSTDRFLEAIAAHPGAVVGLSALLTTTMESMRQTVRTIKERHPETMVIVGGAPITEGFSQEIGADFYAAEPQSAVDYLNLKTHQVTGTPSA